jgi:hypothetical protein
MGAVRNVSHRAEFTRRFEQAFGGTMAVYNKYLDNSFAETRTFDGDWRETVQANGTVLPAGPTRPTLDLGYLMKARNSQMVSPLEMQVSYPIDYAMDVFLGYTTPSGYENPGRPLPQIVAGELEWGEIFREEWDRARA